MSNPTKEDLALFQELIEKHRYDFERLVYLIFPFGEKGHDLEHMRPYKWQIEEWRKLSYHLMDPATRYETYRLIISSGNGAAKTAFGCMTLLMLMYTQRLRARMTANTDPQLKQIVWPEMDVWFRHARFSEHFFEKLGTSIKARKEDLASTWRIDTFTWSEETPQAISGLHNKGGAVAYVFEEAPGIPANIWEYAQGAFTETGTIKLFFAFGNSDDPESKFEQNMSSPLYHTLRIDTRTLEHIDQKQIQSWLIDVGGDEDADDFRVRVRGLPRKSAKDSIISLEAVNAAIARAEGFDKRQVDYLPVILTIDPAWTGGDDTTIAYSQGHYQCLLEKYKLNDLFGQTHTYTYTKACEWARKLNADVVFVDQGEGTALYTLATNDGKTNWELISFASSPYDSPDPQRTQYANLRAQMYYEYNQFLLQGAVLDAVNPEWFEFMRKQLCWTKGDRHKITGKKLAEPKKDIKLRVGASPDVADVLILRGARPILERLPEHDRFAGDERFTLGANPLKMPDLPNPYEDMNDGPIIDATYRNLYD